MDRLTILWAPAIDKVFDMEVEWGFEEALTGGNPPRQVFSRSFEHAFGAPPGANIPVSEMLEAFATNPDLRDKMPQAARYGVRGDQAMKRTAAVVRSPDEPLLSRIRDANLHRTPSGLTLVSQYPPEEVLRRAGGTAAFPAYNVSLGLARTRLGDESFKTEENDLMDEWHACYAPYVTAMALDRRTAGRFRSAQLPDADRVTHKLAEIPRLIARGITQSL